MNACGSGQVYSITSFKCISIFRSLVESPIPGVSTNNIFFPGKLNVTALQPSVQYPSESEDDLKILYFVSNLFCPIKLLKVEVLPSL